MIGVKFLMEKIINKKTLDLIIVDGLGNESHQYENLINKLIKNSKCNFNKISFITSNLEYTNDKFNIFYIDKLDYHQYSTFLFQRLDEYVETDKFLHIQSDGFPINWNMWDDEFLEYDYIGAPWPKYMGWCNGKEVVGNGGLSIRSKKIYRETKKVTEFEQIHRQRIINDDVFISVLLKDHFDSVGVKFAPVELAKKFSVEIPITDDHILENSFGFHGKNYMEQHQFLRDYLK